MSNTDLSVHKAFSSFLTYIDYYRDLDRYRKAAKVLRNGLPAVERGETGFMDIREIKQYLEWILTEEDDMVEIAARDDGSATFDALSDAIKQINVTNPEDIRKVIFEQK